MLRRDDRRDDLAEQLSGFVRRASAAAGCRCAARASPTSSARRECRADRARPSPSARRRAPRRTSRRRPGRDRSRRGPGAAGRRRARTTGPARSPRAASCRAASSAIRRSADRAGPPRRSARCRPAAPRAARPAAALPDAAAGRTPACRRRSETASSPAAGRRPPAGGTARPRRSSEQLAFGDAERRPEDLRQIRDAQRSPFGSLRSPSFLRLSRSCSRSMSAVRGRRWLRSVASRPVWTSPASSRRSTPGVVPSPTFRRYSPLQSAGAGRLRLRARILPSHVARFLVVARAQITGWRSSPSLVHSVNRTSTTSSGFTQCAVSIVLKWSANGLFGVSRARSSCRDAIELLLIEARADRCRPSAARRRRRSSRAAAIRSASASAAAPSSRRRRTPAA